MDERRLYQLKNINKGEKYMELMAKLTIDIVRGDKDLDDIEYLKKATFYGLNAIVYFPSYHSEDILENAIEVTYENIKKIRYRDLLEIFPVEKDYSKRLVPNYFYTMDYVKKVGINKVIGDNIEELLFKYNNRKIMFFAAHVFNLMCEGKISMKNIEISLKN